MCITDLLCWFIPETITKNQLLLFSGPVLSDSLQPHGLQHARLLCLSPSPGAHSDSKKKKKTNTIESVIPSNHLILCCPLLLPLIFPSIRVFPNESALHIRWPKYWSFSLSLSCSNEYSGLISFRMDWFDLLAIWGTLESSPAPQFKSINFLALSLHYGWTLTSIHDYWQNQPFSIKN